jgi:hypothetical protein
MSVGSVRKCRVKEGPMADETYLGNGLYASFDGWQVILRAPREDGDHWIALEPEVWGALLAFERETIAALRADAERRKKAPTE